MVMICPDEMIEQIYDAHTHIHLDTSLEGKSCARALLSSLSGAALMSMEAKDWEPVRLLAGSFPRARCFFGVHPWRAHHISLVSSQWIDDLRRALEGVPASGVGEIGLDRKWRTPDTGHIEYEAQREVFGQQLRLAAELERPVSIHCVHAQGDLMRFLSEAPQLPPTIGLHAFGGARGTVEQLSRARNFGDRIYFGFASCINLRSPKCRAAIAAVPDDRLVIESDRSSAAPLSRIKDDLFTMLKVCAEVKGWGLLEASERLRQNALDLYSGLGSL